MRFPLGLILASLFAGSAVAQSAVDRYGYERAAEPTAPAGEQVSDGSQMRRLTWANKTLRQEGSATEGGPSLRQVSYQPFSPQSPYAAQSPRPSAPMAPYPARSSAPARIAVVSPIPRVMRDPEETRPSRAEDPIAYLPPASRDRAPDVAMLAGGPPPPPAVAQSGGGSQVRYYSLHRGYGLTPDAIPEPQRNRSYVLVGPADPAPRSKEDAGPRKDDADDGSTLPDRPF